MTRQILAAGLLVLGGMLGGFAISNVFGPEAAPHFDRVQVTAAAIKKGEPDAKITIAEKVTAPAVKPVIRATAKAAAQNDVTSFCRAAGWTLAGANLPAPAEVPAGVAAQPDSPAANAQKQPTLEPPSAQLPAIAFPRSGVLTRRSAEFWSVSSTGDLDRAFYRVRYPVKWRADGDSLIVQSSRFGVVRELAPLGPCAAGGVLGSKSNSWIPAAIGCLASAYLIAR